MDNLLSVVGEYLISQGIANVKVDCHRYNRASCLSIFNCTHLVLDLALLQEIQRYLVFDLALL
jgi:hypothetical protein